MLLFCLEADRRFHHHVDAYTIGNQSFIVENVNDGGRDGDKYLVNVVVENILDIVPLDNWYFFYRFLGIPICQVNAFDIIGSHIIGRGIDYIVESMLFVADYEKGNRFCRKERKQTGSQHLFPDILYDDSKEKVNDKSDDHDLPGVGFSPFQQIQEHKCDQGIQHCEDKRPPDDMIIPALNNAAVRIDNERKDKIEKKNNQQKLRPARAELCGMKLNIIGKIERPKQRKEIKNQEIQMFQPAGFFFALHGFLPLTA